MKTTDMLVSSALGHYGVLPNTQRAELINTLLRTAPPTDPRRQRVEQLLQTARERRERAQREA